MIMTHSSDIGYRRPYDNGDGAILFWCGKENRRSYIDLVALEAGEQVGDERVLGERVEEHAVRHVHLIGAISQSPERAAKRERRATSENR